MRHVVYSLMAKASRIMSEARTEAWEKAYRSIEAMQHALVVALDGEQLKGLPNLNTGSLPFRAMRVRGHDIDLKLPKPSLGHNWGQQTLVLAASGELIFVRRNRTGELNMCDVGRPDLKARDVERVTEVIATAMELHIKKATSRAQTFERLIRFAEKVDRILKEGE